MRFRMRYLLMVGALSAGWASAQATPSPVRPPSHMAADAHPSFAVAVIKIHNPNLIGGFYDTQGERFTMRNKSVADLMRFAYALHPKQIEGPRELAFEDHYDIVAIGEPEGEPNTVQQQEEVQKLLADRFNLKFHREQRELPVYAIEVLKGGPKLTVTSDPLGRADWATPKSGATDRTNAFTNATIGLFILATQFSFERPLVDRTGLTGRYDFYLRYNPDESNTTNADSPPGIFTAVQEQLGLRFQPMKALVDVFVIDHVEKPSEN